MTLKIKTILIISTVIMVMMFSACQKNESEKDNVKATGKNFKIAGIVFQADQFFRLVQIGMREAGSKYGVELMDGNSDNKPDKEIQLVNTYIINNVDAIVISPLSSTASVAALKHAYKKGIKIIIYNNALESDVVSAAVESDQRSLGIETGKAARKYIEEKLQGKAKIALLAYKSQLSEQSDARSDGFKQEVMKLPGVQIVAEQDAWLPEMAIKKAGDIITAHPDVNIVWCANEGGTVGAVMAIKNSGKSGKIAVFGTDITDQLMDFLLSTDNILQAVTGQRPFDIGFQAIEMAVKILKREKYENKVIMPGVLLTREDSKYVKDFKSKYHELLTKETK